MATELVPHPISHLEKAKLQLAKCGDMLGLHPNIIERLGSPDKVIQTYSPVRMDNGSIRMFSGYRVQHNNIMGPYQGGIRFHPSVDLDRIKALAMLGTWQASLVGLPYGGAKGGVTVDPHQLSLGELERLTRRHTSDMVLVFDPQKDIPSPDINTHPREMAWMMDTWSASHGYSAPGVVTGKPTTIGGTVGRAQAAGRGVVIALEQYLAHVGRDVKGLRIAIQGFGKLGSVVAEELHTLGAVVIAVSDITGGLYRQEGLDIPDILGYTKVHRFLKGYPEADPISEDEVLLLPCDVLIPASLGGQIHGHNAELIKASIIVEGANAPLTIEADEILERRGITVLPDILANAGGVLVSYFEWVQGTQQLFWSEDEVNDRLRALIARAFAHVARHVETYHCSYRMGAYAEGVGRVAESATLRGLFP